MGSSPSYSYFYTLNFPPVAGTSDQTGTTTSGTASSFTWTGASLTAGDSIAWTVGGQLQSNITYSGLTDQSGNPIVQTNGVYYLLSNVANFKNSFIVPQAGVPACFLSGTRIRTTSGDVAVEALTVGDRVVTLDGETAPVIWIGLWQVADADVGTVPIRVRAHSFGDALPARDLFVSPDHALYLDGVLVPARHLVNGTSIAPTALNAFTYYHVMLDRHDIILAEGLPAESFLDENGDIARFDNMAQAPFARAEPMQPCARRITQGPQLEHIRQSLVSTLV